MKPMQRGIFWSLALAASGAVVLSAQPPPQPRGTVFQEPYSPVRSVAIVAPPAGAPVEFEPTATLDLAYPLEGATLTARLRSRHGEWLPASGLVVRLALGPLADDTMFLMRMQPRELAGPAAYRHPPAVAQLLPETWETVTFSRMPSEPSLPVLVMKRDLRVAATLESVADGTGHELWAHPDVTGLLREALRMATHVSEPR